jgi:two-component sensor histidine kinase
MTPGNLHLVEETFMDKTKALGATLSTIDGEGSIIQLGRNESTGLGVLEATEPEAELIALAEQVDLAETILRTDPRILLDARADMHALANPLVAGEFVGVPLRTHDGFNLGTLCVIDREPHPVAESQIAQLKALASIVMDQMELRLSARRAIADLSRMVDELSRTVDEKEAALRRSELMAKEIDHRVMNSLQLVSGLLDMQSRGVGSSAAEQLALASSRVATIAQVHRHIYQSDGVDKASCKGYLERLCAELSRTLPSAESDAIAVVSEEVELPTAQIVPLGLIVNELVTNSVKQGASRITVSLIREATGGYVLTVTDDGTGLPADFDPASTPGFGMKVLSALARQLGGELRFGGASSVSGANFSIHVAEIPTARNI